MVTWEFEGLDGQHAPEFLSSTRNTARFLCLPVCSSSVGSGSTRQRKSGVSLTDDPKVQTLLAHYLPGREIEVGEGWQPLVKEYLDLLAKLSELTSREVNILLIKEKWGLLDINFQVEDDPAVHALVDKLCWAARQQSRFICDVCGAVGVLHSNGRYRVRCYEHA